MDIITFDAILSKASVMLGFEKEKYTFEYTETENVYVSLKNGHVIVGGACITDYYRGFMLFYKVTFQHQSFPFGIGNNIFKIGYCLHHADNLGSM